ncbi:MAG: hypothetical protein AB1521_02210 [Bacteroidota bacterium]
MQLIDIIFTVLIFGGALLVIVVFISYIVSKTRDEEQSNKSALPPKPIIIRNQIEQPILRNQNPSVVQLYYNPKELKVVRKPTVAKREPPENIYEHERLSKRKTGDNGKRYTIVNEEMQKSHKPKVINFYL